MARQNVACTAWFPSLGLPYHAICVPTTRQLIRKRTDVVRRYIKSHVEAVHRFKAERETTMKVPASALALSDKQLLERIYDGAVAEHKLPASSTDSGRKTILTGDPKAKGAKPRRLLSISVSIRMHRLELI